MLQQHEIESFLIEFHDIFARQRLDIGINEEFTVKLTSKDDSPAYSQSLPTPNNLKEDILAELALLHKYGIITTLPLYLLRKRPMGTSDYWSTCEIIKILSQRIMVIIITQSVHWRTPRNKWPRKNLSVHSTIFRPTIVFKWRTKGP